MFEFGTCIDKLFDTCVGLVFISLSLDLISPLESVNTWPWRKDNYCCLLTYNLCACTVFSFVLLDENN